MQTEKMRRSAPAESGAPTSSDVAARCRAVETQTKFAEFLFARLQPAIWQLGAASARHEATIEPGTPEAEVEKAAHDYDVATFWARNMVHDAIDLADDFVTAFRAAPPLPVNNGDCNNGDIEF